MAEMHVHPFLDEWHFGQTETRLIFVSLISEDGEALFVRLQVTFVHNEKGSAFVAHFQHVLARGHFHQMNRVDEHLALLVGQIEHVAQHPVVPHGIDNHRLVVCGLLIALDQPVPARLTTILGHQGEARWPAQERLLDRPVARDFSLPLADALHQIQRLEALPRHCQRREARLVGHHLRLARGVAEPQAVLAEVVARRHLTDELGHRDARHALQDHVEALFGLAVADDDLVRLELPGLRDLGNPAQVRVREGLKQRHGPEGLHHLVLGDPHLALGGGRREEQRQPRAVAAGGGLAVRRLRRAVVQVRRVLPRKLLHYVGQLRHVPHRGAALLLREHIGIAWGLPLARLGRLVVLLEVVGLLRGSGGLLLAAQ
mmetsp:Transcript_104991/g.321678  ORF Transcript_104991/g.321678 Transcript_104991/m.321678 type:complete len:372 (-) Transcript_104991:3-1118(-)